MKMKNTFKMNGFGFNLTYTIHIQQLISIDKFGIGIYTPFKSAPSV